MKKRTQPRPPIRTSLDDRDLRAVAGGGSTSREAYFVRCDRSTITQ